MMNYWTWKKSAKTRCGAEIEYYIRIDDEDADAER